MNLEATICRPAWVKMDGILYKMNNSLDMDGLDPVFGHLDDIKILKIVSNSLVVFQVVKCEMLFFACICSKSNFRTIIVHYKLLL